MSEELICSPADSLSDLLSPSSESETNKSVTKADHLDPYQKNEQWTKQCLWEQCKVQ